MSTLHTITEEEIKNYEASVQGDQAKMEEFYYNDMKPAGYGGQVMLQRMNMKHATLSEWGLKYLPVREDSCVLDVGCGGGANITRLLAMCPKGKVAGIDHAKLSAEKCAAEHAEDIKAGRCCVCTADVAKLPFKDGEFDAVTAFETVYFWPEIDKAFTEIMRVLRPGGSFLICHECDGTDAEMRATWEKMIPGLKMYRLDEVTTFMERNGFVDLKSDTKKENGWYVLVGHKPASTA